MATYNKSKFEKSTEVLDGNEYKACEFKGCRLVFRGGELPQILECVFTGCDWSFEDASGRTIWLIKTLAKGMGPAGQNFIANIFADR